jgi:hypothetical protein
MIPVLDLAKKIQVLSLYGQVGSHQVIFLVAKFYHFMKNDFQNKCFASNSLSFGKKSQKRIFIIKKCQKFLQHEMMLKIF